LRAGLLISNAGVIENVKKVKPISEINGVAVAMITFMLKNFQYVQDYVAVIHKARVVVQSRARQLNIGTHGITGNSILLDLSNGQAVKGLVSFARSKGFLIKGPFEAPADHHLRISLGSEAMMHTVMDIVEEFINGQKL
jgi:histidinol-phosphate aminotransferase